MVSLKAFLTLLCLVLYLFFISSACVIRCPVFCISRSRHTTRVEDVLPIFVKPISQFQSTEVMENGTSIDDIKKHSRGELTSMRDLEYRTRGDYPAGERLEEMCCTPPLFWWSIGVDVGRVHGKIGCLPIEVIRH